MLDDILKSRGTPNWVDCACLDLETAEAFYKAVFGWASERSVAADGSVYALGYLKGKRVAGLFELPSELIDRGVSSHWRTYIEICDLDAALDKVIAAGGIISEKLSQGLDARQFAVIQDPIGASIRLWKSASQQGVELMHEPGAVAWNELSTNDPDKAAEFYEAVLGVEAETVPFGALPYAELMVGGRRVPAS